MTDKTKKLILGFDAWTRGKHFYLPIANRLDSSKYDFKLLHLGSWGEDKDAPIRELELAVEIIDISFFRNDFFRALELLKPSCVIFTSLEPIGHRAFLHVCKRLGIPTVHLMHGLNSQFAFDSKKGMNVGSSFFRRLKTLSLNLSRYIFHVAPTVFKVLLRTEAKPALFYSITLEMLLKVLGRPKFNLSVLGKADLCLAFLEAERNFLLDRYNYKDDEICIVGFPDAFRFGDKEAVTVCAKSELNLVYLETGFDAMGWQNSLGEFKKTIKELNAAAKSVQYNLKVRLKPSPEKRFVALEEFLYSIGVVSIIDENLLAEIVDAKLILSEPSTLALLPMSLNKTILWNGIPPNSKKTFGDLFLQYPSGRMIESVPELKNTIKNFYNDIAQDEHCSLKWISTNLKLVSEDAFWNNVVSNLKGLIRK